LNTGTISLLSGTFALANTFEQDAGTLAITVTASGSGKITTVHGASVGGTLHMINKVVPADGATLTVLTSNALTWTGTVTTTGQGAQLGHWAAAPTATALSVQWQTP
jgi:hypothetical protein